MLLPFDHRVLVIKRWTEARIKATLTHQKYGGLADGRSGLPHGIGEAVHHVNRIEITQRTTNSHTRFGRSTDTCADERLDSGLHSESTQGSDGEPTHIERGVDQALRQAGEGTRVAGGAPSP